jgi:hypothetical protein
MSRAVINSIVISNFVSDVIFPRISVKKKTLGLQKILGKQELYDQNEDHELYDVVTAAFT